MGKAAKTKGMGPVTCWGINGHGCDASIPDTDDATMDKHGWGFLLAPDGGAPRNNDGSAGLGAYFACPIHRTDRDNDESKP